MSERSERANFEKYFGERLEDLKRKTQEQVKQSYDEWSSEYDKVKSRNNLIIIHLCDYGPQRHLIRYAHIFPDKISHLCRACCFSIDSSQIPGCR